MLGILVTSFLLGWPVFKGYVNVCFPGGYILSMCLVRFVIREFRVNKKHISYQLRQRRSSSKPLDAQHFSYQLRWFTFFFRGKGVLLQVW